MKRIVSVLLTFVVVGTTLLSCAPYDNGQTIPAPSFGTPIEAPTTEASTGSNINTNLLIDPPETQTDPGRPLSPPRAYADAPRSVVHTVTYSTPEVFETYNTSLASAMDQVLRSLDPLPGSNGINVTQPPGTQPGAVDISIVQVTITKDLPEGINPDKVQPFQWLTVDYTPEAIEEYLQQWYPKLCYVFITYKITNTTQQIVGTSALASIWVNMLNNKNQRRISYDTYAVYQGYYDIAPDPLRDGEAGGLHYPNYLVLKPGETREVIMGYRIDEKRWIDETSETEWRFYVWLRDSANMGQGHGWLLDYDKITYIGVKRSGI